MTSWSPTTEDGPMAFYLRLADALAADIRAGRLESGERLPTHRELAARLGVTIGTVSRCYAEAARRGLVSGEVGRGTFVRSHVRSHGREATPIFESTAAGGFIDLGLNHPPPLGAIHEGLLQQTLSELAGEQRLGRYLEYGPIGGSIAHRQAGASWVARAGLSSQPENVLIASGSQHALTAILAALVGPGDVVLTECLTYPGMRALGQLLGVRLEGLPLDDLGLIPEGFEAACQRRKVRLLYTIPTVHNPTGAVLPEARRREVAEIARAHNVLIVEDDVHGLLLEERPETITAFAPDVGIYLSSTAKTLAPGFRVAFLSVPDHLARLLAASLRTTAWTVAPLMVEVVARWIDNGAADAVLDSRRHEARSRMACLRKVLPQDTWTTGAETAHHVWLGLPEPWTSEAFAEAARLLGVGVTPSHAFRVGRATPPRAVRVCLGAARDEHELKRGLRILERLLRDGAAEPPLIV